MGRFGEKTQKARLKWLGHVPRKDDGYVWRMMLRMELSGKTKWGRIKKLIMDAMSEDMAVVEVTKEDAEDRIKRRCKICCGNQ